MIGRFRPASASRQGGLPNDCGRSREHIRQGPRVRHVGRSRDGKAQGRARRSDLLFLLRRLPREVCRRAGPVPGGGGAEARARGHDLHLPDASRDPSARPGPLPDLRHGAGAGSRGGRRGPERGARRHDPALLDRARALGSGLCARNGRASDPSAHACARRGLQLDPIGAFDAGRAVGRLAVLRARLGVGQDPQPQHVHADRHGRRRGLDL